MWRVARQMPRSLAFGWLVGRQCALVGVRRAIEECRAVFSAPRYCGSTENKVTFTSLRIRRAIESCPLDMALGASWAGSPSSVLIARC